MYVSVNVYFTSCTRLLLNIFQGCGVEPDFVINQYFWSSLLPSNLVHRKQVYSMACFYIVPYKPLKVLCNIITATHRICERTYLLAAPHFTPGLREANKVKCLAQVHKMLVAAGLEPMIFGSWVDNYWKNCFFAIGSDPRPYPPYVICLHQVPIYSHFVQIHSLNWITVLFQKSEPSLSLRSPHTHYLGWWLSLYIPSSRFISYNCNPSSLLHRYTDVRPLCAATTYIHPCNSHNVLCISTTGGSNCTFRNRMELFWFLILRLHLHDDNRTRRFCACLPDWRRPIFESQGCVLFVNHR